MATLRRFFFSNVARLGLTNRWYTSCNIHRSLNAVVANRIVYSMSNRKSFSSLCPLSFDACTTCHEPKGLGISRIRLSHTSSTTCWKLRRARLSTGRCPPFAFSFDRVSRSTLGCKHLTVSVPYHGSRSTRIGCSTSH